MRTTLTIDPDVAVSLKLLLTEREGSFKQIVNDALRRGIQQLLKSPNTPRKSFRVRPIKGGRLLIDITSTSRALAIAEGEDYK